jgi:DNA-binding LytR/AlgR family response regulator
VEIPVWMSKGIIIFGARLEIATMNTPQTLNSIIIEDNDIDREMLCLSLQKYPFIHLSGIFTNPIESLEMLKSGKVDLIFSDIDMPEINGIEFFKTQMNPPLCIFVTVHPEYAIDAFDVQAVDYIMKPIREERLDKAIQRTLELIEIKSKAIQYTLQFEQDFMMIREGNESTKVYARDILFLEALTNYTKVVTEKKTYITLQNLKGFLDHLPKEKFIRIHRSYAVSREKIDGFATSEIVIGPHHLPIGKTYRQTVKNLARID